jgi:hypothetical protein
MFFLKSKFNALILIIQGIILIIALAKMAFMKMEHPFA